METQLTPRRTDIETDTYALVIHKGGQDLYQYEELAPWEDPEWNEKCQYDHGEVPPLDLEQTQVEQQTNGESLQKVTLYASELDADGDNGSTTSRSSEDTETESYQGYVIRFSDGEIIPGQHDTMHTTQEQNMGAAIDYLVREYDLIDVIDIAHFTPRARQNCIINSEPYHPNGNEMRGAHKLTGGYYLHTALNKRSKKNSIEHLAEKAGLTDVRYLGDW